MLDAWKKWDERNIGNLAGKTIVVTGGNSGIGRDAAKHFARAGASVVIACRNPDKARAALEEIAAVATGTPPEAMTLDLASLASIRAFVDAYLASERPLDVLVNNAGVMAIPYATTEDGFEMQMGTNHFGHFALTLPLLPRIDASGGRIVNVASLMHVIGFIDFENLNAEKGYTRFGAYNRSKLANMLFTFELDRRLKAAGSSSICVAAHPGYCDTNLQYVTLENEGAKIRGSVMAASSKVFAQTSEMGALPTVRGAVDPSLRGGELLGPRGMGGARGYPIVTRGMPHAYNASTAARLWEASERLTGVTWPLDA